MVTRAATSGKGKFVPAIGQQCHMNSCDLWRKDRSTAGYLYGVKASICTPGCTSETRWLALQIRGKKSDSTLPGIGCVGGAIANLIVWILQGVVRLVLDLN